MNHHVQPLAWCMCCCSGNQHNTHLLINISVAEVHRGNRRRRQGPLQRTEHELD